MSATLEVRGLEVRYQGHDALRGVDLCAEPGGLTVLVGPSGCGKTSLLRAIAGFEIPTAGSVFVGGEPVVGPGRWVPPEKRRVGMVFQQGALFPHLNVLRNVLYGLRGRPRAEARAREALEQVSMVDREHRFPDQLSGGEQQRVALARALAPSPQVILLDEPFASLDASLRRRLRDEVRSVLRSAGTTALLVTHDQEEALSLADLVVVMEAGRILQVGTPDKVYHRPASLGVARFIGDGQTLACRVEAGYARTALGTAPCDGVEGKGWLWVRPEDLELALLSEREGKVGTVEQRTFYGHDLVDTVALSEDLEGVGQLQVRNFSGTPFKVGDRVRLRLKQRQYQAYSSNEPA